METVISHVSRNSNAIQNSDDNAVRLRTRYFYPSDWKARRRNPRNQQRNTQAANRQQGGKSRDVHERRRDSRKNGGRKDGGSARGRYKIIFPRLHGKRAYVRYRERRRSDELKRRRQWLQTRGENSNARSMKPSAVTSPQRTRRNVSRQKRLLPFTRDWYGPKDGLQNYSIYGATCAEAEIDVLTGEHEIQRVDMIFDCGQSLSPEVDIGQIEGAFVMGMGLFLLEEVKYDPKTGRNLTHRLFEYFVPSSKDIPADFRITLLKNAPNPFGVLKSKATGEPPLCMSSVVLLAVQSAIHAAHEELKDSNWVPLSAPATAESILSACCIKNDQLVYKE